MTTQQVLAWSAHLFTSLGLVAAAGIAVLIVQNGDDAFRAAFALMFVATLIDAVDGSLARLVHVKEVLPHFDGRRLDDIIDFNTYTTLPLLLIWRAGVLPDEWAWCLLVPLPVTFALLAVELVFRMQRLHAGERRPRDDAVSAS